MMVVKTVNDYKNLSQQLQLGYYVNYEKILECLNKKLDEFSIPNFFDEPIIGNLAYNIESTSQLYDPVLDPNESWFSMFKRLTRCEPPPLV
jgi:hypothetical protein